MRVNASSKDFHTFFRGDSPDVEETRRRAGASRSARRGAKSASSNFDE
jgi:hypothetical protein